MTYYDDKTLDKVREALRPFLNSIDSVTDAITDMQNAGILFRERRDNPTALIVHRHGDHGWHQHTSDEYHLHQQPIDGEKGPYPVMGGHPAQLTDGFHTMQELYDHRRALTATLAFAAATDGDSWRSKAHHPDDDPMFDGGYFIVGIELPTGTITYHYQVEHWDDFASVPELEHAPKWDGATPADTVRRLLELTRP